MATTMKLGSYEWMAQADTGKFASWLRVGSTSDPLNTSAGDATVGRLVAGDEASIGSAAVLIRRANTTNSLNVLNINNTHTPSSSSTGVVLLNMSGTLTPTANAPGTTYTGLSGSISSAGTFNVGLLTSFSMTAIHGSTGTSGGITALSVISQASSGAGAVTSIVGASLQVGVSGLLNDSAVTHPLVKGLDLVLTGKNSNTSNLSFTVATLIDIGRQAMSRTTIGTLRGINVQSLGTAVAVAGITDLIGIDIAAQSGASNANFGIRNASNLVQTGYARFGAVTVPANTTDGDVTAIRMSLGDSDGPFGRDVALRIARASVVPATAGHVLVDVSGTYAPGGNNIAVNMVQAVLNLAPTTADSGGQGVIVGVYNHTSGAFNQTGTATLIDMQINKTVGGTTTEIIGHRALATFSAGTVSNYAAFRSHLLTAGGTVTNFKHYDIVSTNISASNMVGLNIPNLGGASITTAVGIDIAAQSGATNNFGIRNASNSVQTGYARFGAATAPSNTTDGDVTAIRLRVNGSGTDAAFTSGVTAAEFIGRSRIGGTDSWLDWAVVSTIGNITAPGSGDLRLYARKNADASATTNQSTLWAKDQNSFESAMVQRARTLFPMPLTLPTGVAGTALPANNTSAFVSHAEVDAPIKVNKILYNVSAAGNASNVIRIAVYSENGQQKLIDVTDAVGAATGVRTIDITDTTLAPGVYLFLICHSTFSTTACSVTTYTCDTTITAHIASEPDLGGTLTITAGAAPATIDPTALTTVAPSNKMPVIRLLGTALGS